MATTTMLYLPSQIWTQTPVTPRDTLNATAQSANQTQLSLAAENAPLRVLYGHVRIGPQIACVLTKNGNLVVLMVWGHGEVESFAYMSMDDVLLNVTYGPVTLASLGSQVYYSNGIRAVHYRGVPGQGIDETLRLACLPVAYADTLPGIAYSVFTFPPGASAGFPRINATISGRKIYDPRFDSTNGGTGTHRLNDPTTWGYTDTPAICLADFLTNTTFGAGRSVDWASVAAVAADNEAMIGSPAERRRTLNLALENVQPVSAWTDTLRTYASCWIVPSGATLKFVSDKASSSVATITHAAGQIKSISTLKKRGVQSVPTVLTVTYTDSSTLPWRDGTATVYAGGGTSLPGGTPRRESQVSLPGINRYSQAKREATERIDKLTLNDLSFDLSVFDEHLVLDVGDVVSVTHPIGLTDKLMRVMACSGEYGRYNLNLVEYDPAVYDESVSVAPTYEDASLPDPMGALNAPTLLTTAEEVEQNSDGTYKSRIACGWTAAVDAYTLRYWVTISDATHVVESGYADGTNYMSGVVADGITYTVSVYAERVATQVRSAALTGTLAVVGDQTVPSAVTGVTPTYDKTKGLIISWNAVTNRTIDAYVIRQVIEGGADTTVTVSAGTLSYNFGFVRAKPQTQLDRYSVQARSPNGLLSPAPFYMGDAGWLYCSQATTLLVSF